MTNTYSGVASIKVAPGIGMARVGNSMLTGGDEYFIGPETPGVVPSPATTGTNGTEGYKDPTGAMKRQAQRFRVYGYDQHGRLLGEILEGDTVNGHPTSLTWEVHVTNMKAANYAFQGKYAFDSSQLRNSTIQPGLPPHERDKLIIDPGSMAISGVSQGPIELNDGHTGSTIFDIPDSEAMPISGRLKYDPPQPPHGEDGIDTAVSVTYQGTMVSLGRLYTDADGRLIFVGAEGRSESCTTPSVVISKVVIDQHTEPNPEYNGNSYFNNPGWFDDTCGGSINCTVASTDGGAVNLTTTGDASAQGWVAVAPPHYAPASNNVVSLLDLQMDIFPQADPYTGAGPLMVYGANGMGLTYAASSDGTFPLNPGDSATEPDVVYVATAFHNGVSTYVYNNSSNQFFLGQVQNPNVVQGGNPLGAQTPLEYAPASDLSFGLTVYNGALYHVLVSDGDFYFSQLNSEGTNVYSRVAPTVPLGVGGAAMTAFNGQIYIAAVTGAGSLLVGTTKTLTANNDGIYPTFTFQEITIPDGGLFNSSNVGMSVYRNRLVIAYQNLSNQIGLATSEDGQTFELSPISNSPTAVRVAALGVAAFNNVLYLTVQTEENTMIGSAPDGKTFTFSELYSQTTAAALATNIPVNFYRDIYPTLKTVTDYAWTNERAFHGHRPGATGDFLNPPYLEDLASPDYDSVVTPGEANAARPFVYKFIRPPAQDIYVVDIDGNGQPTGTPTPYDIPAPPTSALPDPTAQVITSKPGVNQRADLMPRLFGNGGSPLENNTNGTTYPNQWLPLTDHQLEKFQQWINGNFVSGDISDAAKQYTVKADGDPVPEPDQLSIAALQPTVGGGFHPGIELTYLMHEPVFFDSAFRFASGTIEGSIAAYMSVPWQGDFWSCNISWWPALRPDIVVEQSPAAVSPGQDPNPNPVLQHIQWFRGPAIPPDSDNVDDYEGGYAVMVDDWHKFGLVTPVVGQIDQGQQVFAETERSSDLDVASLLVNIAPDQTSTGCALNNDSGTIGLAAEDASAAGQAWKLVPNPAQAGTFFIAGGGSGEVLTVDFASGAVSLAAKAAPTQASQVWTYVATGSNGYPGHFNLQSQVNLQLLTGVSDGTVTTAADNAGCLDAGDQIWALAAHAAS